jgi:O-succinylbenzoate synthase
MRITGVEFRWVRLPLVTPFRTSIFTEYDREVLLIRVSTEDGAIGWGECVAMRGGIYSAESLESAEAVLRTTLIPMVTGTRDEISVEEASKAFATVDGHPMAKAALEMALLDAQLRENRQSLAAYFGVDPERTMVPAGVSVGIMPMEELRAAVVHYRQTEKYQRIKIKIQPGWDVEPVRMIRDALGDDVDLQVDGNGAYTLAQAKELTSLDDFKLVMIEQPLAAHDLAGHAELARYLNTPICLDEPITCTADAITAIERRAAAIINIKPGRVGGYLEARDIHDVCRELRVPVWVGGMLETGLGRAANVTLAALPHFELVGDLSASERFFKRDITPPIVMHDGFIPVPTGHGIGVEPDDDALEAATEKRETVFAAGVLTV